MFYPYSQFWRPSSCLVISYLTDVWFLATDWLALAVFLLIGWLTWKIVWDMHISKYIIYTFSITAMNNILYKILYKILTLGGPLHVYLLWSYWWHSPDHTDGTVHTSYSCPFCLFHLDSSYLLHVTLYASDSLACLAFLCVGGSNFS